MMIFSITTASTKPKKLAGISSVLFNVGTMLSDKRSYLKDLVKFRLRAVIQCNQNLKTQKPQTHRAGKPTVVLFCQGLARFRKPEMASSVLHMKIAEAVLLEQHLSFKISSALEEKSIQRRGANEDGIDKDIFVKVREYMLAM